MNRDKKLTQAQLYALSTYFIDVSKTILLAILVGILFPQTVAAIKSSNILIGVIICAICFIRGIILLKGVKKHDK